MGRAARCAGRSPAHHIQLAVQAVGPHACRTPNLTRSPALADGPHSLLCGWPPRGVPKPHPPPRDGRSWLRQSVTARRCRRDLDPSSPELLVARPGQVSTRCGESTTLKVYPSPAAGDPGPTPAGHQAPAQRGISYLARPRRSPQRPHACRPGLPAQLGIRMSRGTNTARSMRGDSANETGHSRLDLRADEGEPASREDLLPRPGARSMDMRSRRDLMTEASTVRHTWPTLVGSLAGANRFPFRSRPGPDDPPQV